jgi:DNA-binding HxlR family transcriptional regulator
VSAPRPGRAVRGSRTGRPIMVTLDLLGRRWALRVLWELRDGSAASFRELRERCDSMSTSVLNQRLAELREAGIVETAPGGYYLTTAGTELLEALAPLDSWAKRWGGRAAGGGALEKLK